MTTAIEVSGARMTIDTVPICPGVQGRYTWRASARALALTVADDGCDARAALFGGTWRRLH